MAARPVDIYGRIDYGKWKPWSVLSIPPNTPAPPATNIPGTVTVAGVTYPGVPITETGILRVIVAENTGVVFNLALTRAGVTSVMPYNAGGALVANCLYLFDVPVIRGDVVNFQFGALTTILMLDAYMIIMQGP
ncbi:unnamed protein product [marine sediment metagenome]|uniref:BclA C-terminal domain-containing protein n=1 Tax=marine sediment metagenome TaxID=412755 RepID=X1MNB6_9ZZZZ